MLPDSRKLDLNSWFVYSSALDYMTNTSTNFLSNIPNFDNHLITIANGSVVPAVGQGNISIDPSFQLKNVLHIPKLEGKKTFYQSTKDLDSFITFFDTHYVLQDKTLSKTIGVAKAWKGLYIIDDMNNLPIAKAQLAESPTSKESEIWAHHQHLDHPSLSYL